MNSDNIIKTRLAGVPGKPKPLLSMLNAITKRVKLVAMINTLGASDNVVSVTIFLIISPVTGVILPESTCPWAADCA